MMFTAGYLRLGSWGAAPLRWHWSLPLGAGFAGQWELRPLSWLLFLGLVLAHEAGHHAAVRKNGLRVIGVDLQGLGGEVRWNGVASPKDQVLLAWSGVLAQLGVMLAAKLVLVIAGGASDPLLAELEYVSITFNAILIGINLLPIPTFDGEVAWKVLALARGKVIPERRTIVLHVIPGADEPEPIVDEARVRAEVEAELAELTRVHNEQAEAGKPGVTSRSRWS
jgi:hypothetical protein